MIIAIRASLILVFTTFLLPACVYRQKQKLEKEVAQLEQKLLSYQLATSEEKAELQAEVLYLRQTLDDLKAAHDSTTQEYADIEKSLRDSILKLEKEISGLEVESEHAALEKAELQKELDVLIDEMTMIDAVENLEVSVAEYEKILEVYTSLGVLEQEALRNNVQETRIEAKRLKVEYPDMKLEIERKILRLEGIRIKVDAYDRIVEIESEVDSFKDVEIDTKDLATISQQQNINSELDELQSQIKHIYDVLPEQVARLNGLILEVGKLKASLAYERAFAEFHKCKSTQATIDAIAEKKAAQCSESDAKYFECMADKEATGTKGAVVGAGVGAGAGGALAALAISSGPVGWVAVGLAALAGSLLGKDVGKSQVECGKPPKCLKDAVKLIQPVIFDMGLELYPYCGDEPKKQDYATELTLELIAPPADSTGSISGDAEKLVESHGSFSSGLQLTESEIKAIKSDVDDIIDLYNDAQEDYIKAASKWDTAKAMYKNTTDEYAKAAANYQTAAANYKKLSTMVIVMAASFTVGQAICASSMSTAQYRKSLEGSGVSLKGKHVDHIIPKKYGGADHPANYQLWDASKNMSCGAGCIPQKIQSNPVGVASGLAVTALSALSCAI